MHSYCSEAVAGRQGEIRSLPLSRFASKAPPSPRRHCAFHLHAGLAAEPPWMKHLPWSGRPARRRAGCRPHFAFSWRGRDPGLSLYDNSLDNIDRHPRACLGDDDFSIFRRFEWRAAPVPASGTAAKSRSACPRPLGGSVRESATLRSRRGPRAKRAELPRAVVIFGSDMRHGLLFCALRCFT